jgi:L-lactate dehydrogenase
MIPHFLSTLFWHSVAYIGKAILNDTRNIMPLSTCVRGLYGIKEDVFLSVPCSVGAHGVLQVMNLPLTPLEEEKFVNTSKTIWDIQKKIWDKI